MLFGQNLFPSEYLRGHTEKHCCFLSSLFLIQPILNIVSVHAVCPEIHAGDVLSSLSLFRVLSLNFFSFLF